MASTIKLPQLAWHGVKELELPVPEGWDVEICNMAGYNRPHMKPDEMRKAIGNPIGTPPLREYARGKKEVVILFDDMARVTRVAEIVPFVLEELAIAGIPDSKIRFISASGCHGALNRIDFARKLGGDVLARFPVYNHNPFDNCIHVGTTSRGTRVIINAEVMKCDLKIGIGSIVPHIMAGFAGGSKILLPGVAARETMQELHRTKTQAARRDMAETVTGMGVMDSNPRRQDIDEAGELAGLDFKIDAIVNLWGETVSIYAGSSRKAFAEGVKEAKTHYLTPAARDKDIVIANTFAKANEAVSGLVTTVPAVSPRGGDIVVMANVPEGQVVHYLLGPFGNIEGGAMRLRIKTPQNVNRIIIFTEYPEIASNGYIEEHDKIVLAKSWSEVLELLKERHGPDARVAVYPNSDIQYCG